MSDKQISQQLGMSVATVRTHMSRLFAKFDVKDRIELILLMMNRYCKGYCPYRPEA